MPWKNGGGSTMEIAIEPAGASLTDPFVWRVSSARVAASGPFSRFPGYVRSLVLLEGAGLLLDIPGKARQRLKNVHEPLAFNGDDAVNATLIQGPCVDFGIISDPSKVRSAVQVLNLGPGMTSFSLAPATLLFAPRGLVEVDPLGIHLGASETLVFKDAGSDSAATLELRASASGTPLVAVQFWPVETASPEIKRSSEATHG